MRKMLSVLASTSLTAAAAITVVSCGSSSAKTTSFNYQSGPRIHAGSNTLKENDFVTSINVGSENTYSVYNAKSGNLFSPVFNGDLKNVIKTRDDNFSLKAWKKDSVAFQNILYFKKDPAKYKNLKLTIEDKTNQIPDDQKATGTLDFEKYILSKPFKDKNLDKSIPTQRQYVPDAVVRNRMESLTEHVKDNFSDRKTGNATFSLWNAWGNILTTDKTRVGEHNMNINISFDYDGKSESFDKPLIVDVKDNTVDLSKYDYNGDGKTDSNDNFGFSAETFPSRGLQWYKDVKYKDVPHWLSKDTKDGDVEAEIPKNVGNSFSWTTSLTDMAPKGIDLSGVTINRAFISSHAISDSDFQGTITNASGAYEINWMNKKPALPFSALYEVIKNKNVIGWFSVYYNDFGHQQVDNVKDENGDIIGPIHDYADMPKRSAEKLRDMKEEIKPLEQSNSQFTFGTGTTEQLIQYTGKLVDSTPNYDYEKSLKEASKTEDGTVKFLTSVPGKHEWTWNFDFTNLDTLMRISADRNIPEVLINPVDKNGFGFWYLKGDKATKGPLRYLMDKNMKGGKNEQGAVNIKEGKMTEAGKQYLKTVMVPFAKHLSEHLSKIHNSKDKAAYTTKDTNQPVNVYIDFDELNEDTVDRTMAVMRDNAVPNDPSGKIYGSAYMGWRSDFEFKDINGSEIKKTMLDGFDLNGKHYNPIDQFILVYRNIYRERKPNAMLDSFRDIVDKRDKTPGLRTMLYNTGQDFPGTYSQSDLSDPYWQILLSYRLHTQGWARWAYDFLLGDPKKDSYLDDASATEGAVKPDTNTASGESFFIYGGNDVDGVYYSKRMLAMINAVSMVHKIMMLNKENGAEAKSIDKALLSIGLTKPGMDLNNDYKWNVSAKAPDNFEEIKDNSKTSTSLQVDKLMALLNDKLNN